MHNLSPLALGFFYNNKHILHILAGFYEGIHLISMKIPSLYGT